jgi:8-oxo-dGTP diphosphatase
VWYRLMTYYFYDKSRQFISLTFERRCFLQDAKHVLIWMFADEKEQEIVLTRHKRRGWELPGGKVEAGETPEEAAHRELFEETGVRTDTLCWVGQYIIEAEGSKEQVVKNIYAGIAREWNNIPEGFETIERAIFPLSLMPFRQEMSSFIQDNIFPLCREYVKKQRA